MALSWAGRVVDAGYLLSRCSTLFNSLLSIMDSWELVSNNTPNTTEVRIQRASLGGIF